MAIGDIDNDGRIDAVVTTNGGPPHILHNETVTHNHWITLHLTGHKSNRDGIGAVVKLTTSSGIAMGHRDHLKRLSVRQRSSGAFWFGRQPGGRQH